MIQKLTIWQTTSRPRSLLVEMVHKKVWKSWPWWPTLGFDSQSSNTPLTKPTSTLDIPLYCLQDDIISLAIAWVQGKQWRGKFVEKHTKILDRRSSNGLQTATIRLKAIVVAPPISWYILLPTVDGIERMESIFKAGWALQNGHGVRIFCWRIQRSTTSASRLLSLLSLLADCLDLLEDSSRTRHCHNSEISSDKYRKHYSFI